MATGFIPIQRPGLGARVRRWISKTFRKGVPTERPPPPTEAQMQALRDWFAKAPREKTDAH